MPKVGIVMGSDSDLKVMSKAAATLEKFVSVNHWGTIISMKPFPLDDDGCYLLKDGINFLDECCTLDDFIEMNQDDEMNMTL